MFAPTAGCTECDEEAWKDLDDTPYVACMRRLELIWEAEQQGDWLTRETQAQGAHDSTDPSKSRLKMRKEENPFAAKHEYDFLRREVEQLSHHIPDSQWPVPHLRRRLGRLLSRKPGASQKDLAAANRHLHMALVAMRDWHGEETAPIILSTMINQLEANLRIVRMAVDKVTGGVKTRTPDGRQIWVRSVGDRDARVLLGAARDVVLDARVDAMALYRANGSWMGQTVERYAEKFDALEAQLDDRTGSPKSRLARDKQREMMAKREMAAKRVAQPDKPVAPSEMREEESELVKSYKRIAELHKQAAESHKRIAESPKQAAESQTRNEESPDELDEPGTRMEESELDMLRRLVHQICLPGAEER